MIKSADQEVSPFAGAKTAALRQRVQSVKLPSPPEPQNTASTAVMPQPMLLSTWSFGQTANAAGWPHLAGENGNSLDAVEQACRAVEADPAVRSVGWGGRADRSGQVSLDASIMLSPGRCGAVCYVRRYLHVISIARLVMEHLPHVLVAGEGAERLAAAHAVEPADLLTDASRAEWQAWAREHPQEAAEAGTGGTPAHENEDSHDTIGVLALDATGTLAGGCSTSGLAYKFPGRVGDSPIIGHGLYVEPRYGAAVATGNGELMMGVSAAFLAVELLRRGATAADAAVAVVERIVESYHVEPHQQAALIVLEPTGRWSAAALRPGYKTAVRTASRDELVEPEHVILKAES